MGSFRDPGPNDARGPAEHLAQILLLAGEQRLIAPAIAVIVRESNHAVR